MVHSTSHAALTDAVVASVTAAFGRAAVAAAPYRHWLLHEVLPAGMTDALRGLPFPSPELGGVSGKRELHNDQRHYFDAEANARFDVCAAVADAFQDRRVTSVVAATTGADLDGTFVRLEYAQDTDGFWLEPHTDLGVKRLTMLIYLPQSPEQADLGTDIYSDRETWSGRPPFADNTALVFVPGTNTWHGLAPRTIVGVRKTVIMNYVTSEWRAREQLAYPLTPVRA